MVNKIEINADNNLDKRSVKDLHLVFNASLKYEYMLTDYILHLLNPLFLGQSQYFIRNEIRAILMNIMLGIFNHQLFRL